MSTEHEWPEGYDLIKLQSVDSTNSYAARVVPEIHRPTWIIAHEQTSGRGRSGRTWIGRNGNLTATLIYRPDCDPPAAALRSFVAANALFDALARYVPSESLSVKWPNDVLLAGAKVAGILLESSGSAGRVDWLAVGIGVNLNQAPNAEVGMHLRPTCLGDHGPSVAPLDFLGSLAVAFHSEEQFLVKDGFEPVREKWLSRAARIGQEIRARTAREEISGVFETLDQVGNLVLRTAEGHRTLAAADVFFD